ncbi:molecular chaperone DnaJ [Actinocorallia sp. API 0066]|uniref:molecular chaperone DnaJ n=1 Tax=Actinocorallia sp. API 0066 TaxID=2896846 RepID=UPI001E2D8C22|nr:molecular chaperone DnaJ [Actinocorallia sp. API 0066]MCD0451066.1 molecular chaperone DnaJ [Actinocorallia sp. API 0066]
MTVEEALALLEREPADVFGSDPAEARRVYHRLARALHPDTGADPDGFTRLTERWRAYRGTTVLRTRKAAYQVGARIARGDIADLYAVRAPDGDALLKMPRDPADGDLVEREAVALRQLAADGDPRFLPYVPRLIERVRYQGRSASVQSRCAGFRTLAEVRAARPDGLDPRDAAWMWRRLLVALGFAHRAGVLHGAVLPEHVMIHPEAHGLVLVGWGQSVPGCYADTDPSGRVPLLVEARASFYPPEVPARERAVEATDLFMATRVMTYLMGPLTPAPLRAFARGCTLASPRRRPSDAWRLLAELDDLLERLYGPRTFRPFAL